MDMAVYDLADKEVTASLNLCVIGGSNSVMRHGYVPPLVAQIENVMGLQVNLKNLAIGGTFSQFGLWQLLAKKSHRDADVIIVEYGLNDSELATSATVRQWAKAYEGLIRRIRHEAPQAQIICPLLFSRHRAVASGLSSLSSGVVMINKRYEVATIDVPAEIAAKAPPDYWSVARDWYADGSHYARPFQVMIAELIVAEIRSGAGRSHRRNVPPISHDHFADVRSAAEDRILQTLIPEGIPTETFRNSVISETAYVITPGNMLQLRVTGEIVALIIVSTRNDGVVAYRQDETVTYAGLYRKAFADPKFRFLMNTFLPEQYLRTPPLVSESPSIVRIEVLDAASVAALQPRSVVSRSTAMIPPDTDHAMSLALVDIIYTGELSSI